MNIDQEQKTIEAIDGTQIGKFTLQHELAHLAPAKNFVSMLNPKQIYEVEDAYIYSGQSSDS